MHTPTKNSSRTVVPFPRSADNRFDEIVSLVRCRNVSAALDETIRLIDEGNVDAYTFAGYFYETGGNGVVQDFDNALFYYNKAIAEAGSVEAYLALARMYYFGKGVNVDYSIAYEYYSRVRDESGNAVASLMLGQMYEHGHSVDVDTERAKKLYNEAFERNNLLGLTHLALLAWKERLYFASVKMRLKAARLAFTDPATYSVRRC